MPDSKIINELVQRLNAGDLSAWQEFANEMHRRFLRGGRRLQKR